MTFLQNLNDPDVYLNQLHLRANGEYQTNLNGWFSSPLAWHVLDKLDTSCPRSQSQTFHLISKKTDFEGLFF